MSIAPNFTIVTLGVDGLEKSIAFSRALGWEQRGDGCRRWHHRHDGLN